MFQPLASSPGCSPAHIRAQWPFRCSLQLRQYIMHQINKKKSLKKDILNSYWYSWEGATLQQICRYYQVASLSQVCLWTRHIAFPEPCKELFFGERGVHRSRKGWQHLLWAVLQGRAALFVSPFLGELMGDSKQHLQIMNKNFPFPNQHW